MGDPVTTAAIVAGAGMAGQTYLGGRQARNQAKIEGSQLKTQKQALETNAALSQAERLRKLKSILASQNAAFAMSGQTSGAGTASAIQAGSISEAAREQRIANLQTDVASSALDYNIWSAQKTADTAMANTILTNTLNTMTRVGEAYVAGSFSGGGSGGGNGGGGK